MAGGDELLDFVRDALSRGVPRGHIEDALRQRRLDHRPDPRRAERRLPRSIFRFPCRAPRPYLSAREAFIYLVLFGTLYASAYNLGSLMFDFINRAFPDAAQTGEGFDEYIRQSIRWSISSLIVAFPGVPVSVVADRA